MRWWLKASGGLVLLGIVVFAYANWESSALHLRVCGPNSSSNFGWLLYGSRANENWPAKFCGCKVPDVFAEGIRRRFDSNPGALMIERALGKEKLRKALNQFGFGKAVK